MSVHIVGTCEQHAANVWHCMWHCMSEGSQEQFVKKRLTKHVIYKTARAFAAFQKLKPKHRAKIKTILTTAFI